MRRFKYYYLYIDHMTNTSMANTNTTIYIINPPNLFSDNEPWYMYVVFGDVSANKLVQMTILLWP